MSKFIEKIKNMFSEIDYKQLKDDTKFFILVFIAILLITLGLAFSMASCTVYAETPSVINTGNVIENAINDTSEHLNDVGYDVSNLQGSEALSNEVVNENIIGDNYMLILSGIVLLIIILIIK